MSGDGRDPQTLAEEVRERFEEIDLALAASAKIDDDTYREVLWLVEYTRRYVPMLLDEVERLRKWRKDLLDEGFGYDDSEESAAEVLEMQPTWRWAGFHAEDRAESAEREAARLRAQVEALAREAEGEPVYIENWYGRPAHVAMVSASDLRAALADVSTADGPPSREPRRRGRGRPGMSDKPTVTAEQKSEVERQALAEYRRTHSADGYPLGSRAYPDNREGRRALARTWKRANR